MIGDRKVIKVEKIEKSKCGDIITTSDGKYMCGICYRNGTKKIYAHASGLSKHRKTHKQEVISVVDVVDLENDDKELERKKIIVNNLRSEICNVPGRDHIFQLGVDHRYEEILKRLNSDITDFKKIPDIELLSIVKITSDLYSDAFLRLNNIYNTEAIERFMSETAIYRDEDAECARKTRIRILTNQYFNDEVRVGALDTDSYTNVMNRCIEEASEEYERELERKKRDSKNAKYADVIDMFGYNFSESVYNNMKEYCDGQETSNPNVQILYQSVSDFRSSINMITRSLVM